MCVLSFEVKILSKREKLVEEIILYEKLSLGEKYFEYN